MRRLKIAVGVILIFLLVIGIAWKGRSIDKLEQMTKNSEQSLKEISMPGYYNLSVDYLKNRNYDADLKIEKQIDNGSNYRQYLFSYISEGNKIYGLLTLPQGRKPAEGWPAIILNHGYIDPKKYSTTQSYAGYTRAIALKGYVVFKPDYRGNGDSEGLASGAYANNDYTIDVLNGLAALKKYSEVNPDKIGMWGHSMGGYITLRAMVVNKDIKAASIWSGVVGSPRNMLLNWHHEDLDKLGQEASGAGSAMERVKQLLTQFGENSSFWRDISSNQYVANINGPVQIQAAKDDQVVPVAFSQELERDLNNAGKKVETYYYENDDHNLSKNFSTATQRMVSFFENNL